MQRTQRWASNTFSAIDLHLPSLLLLLVTSCICLPKFTLVFTDRKPKTCEFAWPRFHDRAVGQNGSCASSKRSTCSMIALMLHHRRYAGRGASASISVLENIFLIILWKLSGKGAASCARALLGASTRRKLFLEGNMGGILAQHRSWLFELAHLSHPHLDISVTFFAGVCAGVLSACACSYAWCWGESSAGASCKKWLPASPRAESEHRTHHCITQLAWDVYVCVLLAPAGFAWRYATRGFWVL